MDLESLEQENKEYLKRLFKKERPKVVGLCFMLVFFLFDTIRTGFSLLSIVGLLGLIALGIMLLLFSSLEQKDKLLDDFFVQNHLIMLENIREINQHNSFGFSKEHLTVIIRDIARRIIKLKHNNDTECVANVYLDGTNYEVTYKIVKNEIETNIFQVAFLVKEPPYYREGNVSKKDLPLYLINRLYKIKKRKRKKSEKAFKILKITGRTDFRFS